MFHSFIFLRRISYFLLNKMLFVSYGEVWLLMINSWLWLIAVFLLFPAKSFFLFFSRKKLSPLTKTFAQVKRLSAPLLFTAKVCKVGSSRTDEVSGQFSIEISDRDLTGLWPEKSLAKGPVFSALVRENFLWKFRFCFGNFPSISDKRPSLKAFVWPKALREGLGSEIVAFILAQKCNFRFLWCRVNSGTKVQLSFFMMQNENWQNRKVSVLLEMFSVISDTKTKVSLCQRLQPPTKILRLSFLCQRIKPPKNEKDSCRRFELPKQKIGKHFSKDSSKDKVFPWKEIEAFLLNCHCRPGGSLVKSDQRTKNF